MDRPVMVVDDDPDVLQMITVLLENAGLTVVPAEDGMACLTALRNGFKGLILLDVMMPEMDGCAVIRAMAAAGYTEGNIICMFTAQDTPDAMLAEYNQYVLEYIRKPPDPELLVKTVKDCLSYFDR